MDERVLVNQDQFVRDQVLEVPIKYGQIPSELLPRLFERALEHNYIPLLMGQ